MIPGMSALVAKLELIATECGQKEDVRITSLHARGTIDDRMESPV